MADVIVLGTGMIGVSTALALQARGRDVLLIDRKAPGRETSYGNGGLIHGEAAEPYPMPRDHSALWNVALRRDNNIHWTFDALPSQARALFAYWWHSQPARHMELSKTYHAITARSPADHHGLIEASGASDIIRHKGYRTGFGSKDGFDRGRAEAQAVADRWGLKLRVLSGDELAAEEPALTRRYAGAIEWQDAISCTDPGALVQAYADLFTRRGGKVEKSEISAIAPIGAGWRVHGSAGTHEAADLVLAAGPWTPRLIAPLGYRLRMVRKRGYHLHFKGGTALDMIFADADRTGVLIPTRMGTRLLTGAQVVREGAAPNPVQLAKVEAQTREFIDLGRRVEAQPWHGDRPCMPDMLPVVGALSKHRGLWLNTGHGHQGFTLGPTTAELLADDMLTGQTAHPVLRPARLGL